MPPSRTLSPEGLMCPGSRNLPAEDLQLLELYLTQKAFVVSVHQTTRNHQCLTDRKDLHEALQGLSKAIEGLCKTFKGLNKPFDDPNKALKGLKQALRANTAL